MSVRPAVRALAPYHFSARPHEVKLDQNESPYDLPAELKARALERLAGLPWNRYPDLQGESLRAALAQYHAWEADGIALASGSNVLIAALVGACGLGGRVLSVSPTFSVYAQQARLLGAELVELPLGPDFSLPMAALLDGLAEGEGVCFLANPAAPTGNVFPEEQVVRLVEAAAPGWTMVLDEAYQQFSGTDFSGLARLHEHVVCLRTFSKAFGLGGVRLGYALASSGLAEALRKMLLPFSVSSLQLAIGLTVLEEPGFVGARVAEALGERERMRVGLSGLPGVRVYESRTNFLLFRVADAAAFYGGLLECGVLVRRQDHLPGLSGCLRVSVGRPAENDAFLAAARQVAEVLANEGGPLEANDG